MATDPLVFCSTADWTRNLTQNQQRDHFLYPVSQYAGHVCFNIHDCFVVNMNCYHTAILQFNFQYVALLYHWTWHALLLGLSSVSPFLISIISDIGSYGSNMSSYESEHMVFEQRQWDNASEPKLQLTSWCDWLFGQKTPKLQGSPNMEITSSRL